MKDGSDSTFVCDELDLLIIGELLRRPDSTFRQIASEAGVDQRTVARRVDLMKADGVIKRTYDVDWEKLGVGTAAFVGCTTSVGERSVGLLREYLRDDPRVVESYDTVGAHQYFVKVLSEDLSSMRNSILSDLEPLTADLSASVISESKPKSYFQFVRYLRETRYPKSRSRSWGQPDGDSMNVKDEYSAI